MCTKCFKNKNIKVLQRQDPSTLKNEADLNWRSRKIMADQSERWEMNPATEAAGNVQNHGKFRCD